jgi:hypothetical protein
MPVLLMLAQVAQGWSPTTVVEIVAGALGGTGILATLLLVAAKGYWTTTVAPLVESEVRKWYHHPDQVEARAKERALSFKDWYDKREQHDEREKELQNLLRTPSVVDESTKSVKLIIDNEIKRSDGLISREITTKVNDMESRLLTKLEEMAQLQRDDTLLKQKMLQEMGQLKGAINTMLPSGQLASVSPTPPERKPR